jgi:hypothetical protein
MYVCEAMIGRKAAVDNDVERFRLLLNEAVGGEYCTGAQETTTSRLLDY